jgi:hypothetical protein
MTELADALVESMNIDKEQEYSCRQVTGDKLFKIPSASQGKSLGWLH